MDMILWWPLVVLGCVLIYPFFYLVMSTFFREQQTPLIIKYVNLLHKHQDPEHPALRTMYLSGDKDFQRRARAMHRLWRMK